MLNMIIRMGHGGVSFIQSLGRSLIFLLSVLTSKLSVRIIPAMIEQVYFVGFLSCLIIIVAGLFIGMVVGLQGYHTLEKFGAGSHLGQLLALSITRELGPVVSALLFAGRAGSAVTAEIGLMKATDQLAGMDMMGIDPLSRIIYPRFLAGLIALPVLSLIFSMVAIFGGYFIGVDLLGVDSGSFWSNMQSQVNFRIDVVSGIIKSFVFAFVVIWTAVYQGFQCEPTAEGISKATTKTVVYSSLQVLGLDFLLTAIMIGDW